MFVTAYDHYAVEAFAQGALDYLLKPVEPARLAATVSRLQERLRSSRPAINTEQLLQQLSHQVAQLATQQGGGEGAPLRWIRAQVGKTVRLIAIDDVDYLRRDLEHEDALPEAAPAQPEFRRARLVPARSCLLRRDPYRAVRN